MEISVKIDASATTFTYKRKLVALWESMSHRHGKIFLPFQLTHIDRHNAE